MNLRGISQGDLVQLSGDPSLWQVEGRQGRRVQIVLPRGSRVRRTATSYEVVAAWRKVRR